MGLWCGAVGVTALCCEAVGPWGGIVVWGCGTVAFRGHGIGTVGLWGCGVGLWGHGMGLWCRAVGP